MSQPDFKTIAAIATPPGYGGIGIVRISGSEASSLSRKLLRNGNALHFTPSHSTLQQIINPENGNVIDEALVTFFRAPHSFTGEDVVEISCHGSPAVLAEILRLLTA